MEDKLYKLYFLSEKNMDGRVIIPRIPDNYFTKNGYEDNTTRRLCFSTSVGKALMALSMNCKGKEFYVHRPIDNKQPVLVPTKEQVPDCEITDERWLLKPVKLKCVGAIRVIDDDGKDGYTFTYGENQKATLYGWKWKYLSFSIND